MDKKKTNKKKHKFENSLKTFSCPLQIAIYTPNANQRKNKAKKDASIHPPLSTQKPNDNHHVFYYINNVE